jgi:hypothetical protein
MFLPPGFSIAANGNIYSSDGRGPYPFAEAAFFFGRRRHISKELNIPANQKLLVKFVVGVDALLRFFGATLDNGHARLTLYKGGTTSGVFSETLTNLPTNWTEEVPAYTSEVAVTATPAGTPTISGAEFVAMLRIKTANQANSSQSVSGSLGAELGLGVATYYALIENIGTGSVEGILQARWDEFPNN